MLRLELAEIIRNGENSGVEFKRDHEHVDSIAKELVALLNLRGGRLLLGVEDDGTVTGLTREAKAAEQWVLNVCRQNIQPPLIPFWETIEWEPGKVVAVISVPADAPDKPYKAHRGAHWVTFVRAGSTSREASRDEESRLYQSSGMVRHELRPVPGARLADLDLRRLHDYFARVRGQAAPAPDDVDGWVRLLINTELMVELDGRGIPTIAAVLLFGTAVSRWLPRSGVTATVWPTAVKDYATRERLDLRGPLVGLRSSVGLVEAGIVEQSLDFVRRNTWAIAELVDGTRVERRQYPESAVREALVNALVHRDYSIAGTDVELNVFPEAVEIISPGRLPNTMTVDRMKAGSRYARNTLLQDVMGDYEYVDARGLGVPRKIIQGMREHNGTEPVLTEDETRFIVRLIGKAPSERAPTATDASALS